ncbi:MAG: hypothetical protein IRZ15_16890 [Bryobacteraceae bacterium]|nr:hypothetical protein [Bryobacteraceae bacterium]
MGDDAVETGWLGGGTNCLGAGRGGGGGAATACCTLSGKVIPREGNDGSFGGSGREGRFTTMTSF